jgi:hypothetical protein
LRDCSHAFDRLASGLGGQSVPLVFLRACEVFSGMCEAAHTAAKVFGIIFLVWQALLTRIEAMTRILWTVGMLIAMTLAIDVAQATPSIPIPPP